MFDKIAEGFTFTVDEPTLLAIPRRVVSYGRPPDEVKRQDFHWMQYENQGQGTISFSRNTLLGMPNAVQAVIDFLAARFPSLELRDDHIHFAMTEGHVPAHRDEKGRNSAINIGLVRSHLGVTRMSLDNSRQSFDTRYADFQVEDGSVYLMNTLVLHKVIGRSLAPRIMLSVSLSQTYKTARAQLGLPERSA